MKKETYSRNCADEFIISCLCNCLPEHLRLSISCEITSCSALSLSLYHKFISELENYKEKMEQINVDDEQPTSMDMKIHPCVVVGVKKAVGTYS